MLLASVHAQRKEKNENETRTKNVERVIKILNDTSSSLLLNRDTLVSVMSLSSADCALELQVGQERRAVPLLVALLVVLEGGVPCPLTVRARHCRKLQDCGRRRSRSIALPWYKPRPLIALPRRNGPLPFFFLLLLLLLMRRVRVGIGVGIGVRSIRVGALLGGLVDMLLAGLTRGTHREGDLRSGHEAAQFFEAHQISRRCGQTDTLGVERQFLGFHV